MTPRGSLCFVLHGHLPYIRHPEHPDFLEERWFFEAVTETYLPLLDRLTTMADEGVPFRLTISISPTLGAMLGDPLLQERYLSHLDHLQALAEREGRRTAGDAAFQPAAEHYRQQMARCRWLFAERFRGDLLGAFRRLAERGCVELMTCAATHGFLPLMAVTPAAIAAQVEVGCQAFEQAFGWRPAGLWLPECGYHPAVEPALKASGVQYTFVERHGLLYGRPRPAYGVYAPVRNPTGTVVFGRDPETTRQVWSARDGYPGDPWYREFYRDIGFELPLGHLGSAMHPDGFRTATGFKYYRITGETDDKQPYEPARAAAQAEAHAGNFVFNRERQVEHLAGALGGPPLIVSPYDAELFGHWWYEGPHWLELVLRKLAAHPTVGLTTPSEYLRRGPRLQTVAPCLSSWGWKGYNEMWLQGANTWIYPHLHHASQRMSALVRAHPSADGLRRRALTQALRELLMAQASDWAFIMATGTAVDYACMRTRQHLARFLQLDRQITRGTLDARFVAECETRTPCFPWLDYRAHG
ncbi:MAG: glycoside hydrolase [Omnitrophica WOR_2 bacterium RIFCSPHIGHO2_02_FULL_68_15]|nr:MAG: glycoside hydrolase [Omnitrophica WOR_2 bacterium RIFCSPHIGHO2_02_FULL_68_15]